MRHLTASQKIAQLEHRISQLEKEAGLFDLFGSTKKDILALAGGVAKKLKKYKIINEFGSASHKKTYKHHEVQIPVVGARGIPVKLQVMYDELNSTIHVVLFRPRQQGYDRTVVYMKNFVPGNEDSLGEFVKLLNAELSSVENRNQILYAIQ